jgi:hypothetical protein
VRCNHCFQHDCNLPLAHAIGSGNLAAIRSFCLRLRAIKIFVHSADHFCLQNLQERLRFPQCTSHMKPSLRQTSCSQADELTWLSPSSFSQAEAVKPQPMLNLPDSSDIDDFHRRSS